MHTLNIVGGGKVGKALARLWAKNHVLAVQDILNRSLESAEEAASFIGAGTAVSKFRELRRADFVLLAVPDDALQACCRQLADEAPFGADTIVFHVSGALSSSELAAASARGARVASAHPAKTFAVSEHAASSFEGTWCTIEGEAAEELERIFMPIGARCLKITPAAKPLYHAGTVFACNFVTGLLEIGERLLGAAGIERAAAREVLAPLVRETVENTLSLGPTRALTGPVVRADTRTLAVELDALGAHQPAWAELYRLLGLVLVETAQERLSADARGALAETLRSPGAGEGKR